MNQEYIDNFLNIVDKTDYYCRINLPSDIKSELLGFKWFYSDDYIYFIGCYDSDLIFYATSGGASNGDIVRLIYYNFEHNYFRFNQIGINASEISTTSLAKLSNRYNHFRYSEVFDSNNNYSSSFLSRINVNNSYYDDFINSNKPSEYIITMLYIFIPVLLFIFGLKVFKKGLFR